MDAALVSAGTLYIVASPLGNLNDLSPRAASILAGVPLVAAEDTRRARTLLGRSGSSARVTSFHAHSAPKRISDLLARLAGGDSVALVTDAGTPGISDPGAELVRRAHEAGIPVRTIPGPSAVTAALSVSGMPADRYIFLGFIPRKGADRRAAIEQAARSPFTVVCFEAANRLVPLLEDLAGACGPERTGVVARELTKIHEEARSGTLPSLTAHYRDAPPRGEVTLVIEGRGVRGASHAPADPADLRARAAALLATGLSRRDVAAHVADALGVSRNEAYRVVMTL